MEPWKTPWDSPISKYFFPEKWASLNKACFFIKEAYSATNQYSYVFIGFAVSFRGKDPFSRSGNLKFEITIFF